MKNVIHRLVNKRPSWWGPSYNRNVRVRYDSDSESTTFDSITTSFDSSSKTFDEV